jgi:hypothetical protein
MKNRPNLPEQPCPSRTDKGLDEIEQKLLMCKKLTVENQELVAESTQSVPMEGEIFFYHP